MEVWIRCLNCNHQEHIIGVLSIKTEACPKCGSDSSDMQMGGPAPDWWTGDNSIGKHPAGTLLQSTVWPNVMREIVDHLDYGYGWRYPFCGEKSPDGSDNYFTSEGSDPWFEMHWRLATAEDIERYKSNEKSGVVR